MARIPIILPPLGMKSEEIRFGSWLTELGTAVSKGDDFFEVEADKATVVCEAEAAGVFAEAVAEEGNMVKEGDVLGYIDA